MAKQVTDTPAATLIARAERELARYNQALEEMKQAQEPITRAYCMGVKQTAIPALAAAVVTLAEALEWYADEGNWNWDGSLDDVTGADDSDKGNCARAALTRAAAAMEASDE